MRHIHIRPFRAEEKEKLDLWRFSNYEANLEVPFGYSAPGVETAVADKDETPIAALTASAAVVLDPLIQDPKASGIDIISALLKLEAALTYVAAQNGMTAAYIAVPKHLTGYIALLEKNGYVNVLENCVILRRPLRPHTEPSLEDARDQASEIIAKSEPDKL